MSRSVPLSLTLFSVALCSLTPDGCELRGHSLATMISVQQRGEGMHLKTGQTEMTAQAKTILCPKFWEVPAGSSQTGSA